MSDKVFWLGAVGILAFAALVLWLRDRVRDARHVPENERKLSERRNLRGATSFVCFLWAAGSAVRVVQTIGIVPRVMYTAMATVFVWISWHAYKGYHQIGVEIKREHLLDRERN